MIICLTSLVRAGKDTFADYLVEKYGFVKLNMSDVLRDALIAENKEPTKDNMSKLGDDWRKKFGMDIVIRKTLEKASKHDRVVITGMRSVEEVTFMKANAGELYLIAIIADREVRFERRSEADSQTEKEFFVRDERDIRNKGLDKVIAIADYEINNNFQTKEEFYREIDILLEKAGIK